MAKYSFNDFLRECKEAWKEIWKEDLPKTVYGLYPNEKYITEEMYNDYKERKDKLSKHRRKVSIILIFVLLVSLNVFNYIKKSEFISCIGKDVCIYRGPKLNYPCSRYLVAKIDDEKFLINSYPYNYFLHRLINIPIIDFTVSTILKNGTYRMSMGFKNFSKTFVGYQNHRFEYYDLKHNKIKKIKSYDNNFNKYLDFFDSSSALWFNGCFINYKNKILYLYRKHAKWSTKHIYSVDFINQEGEYFDKNIFRAEDNNNDLEFEYITKYDENNLLIMGYKKYTQFYEKKIPDTPENNYSRLYLYNLETKEINPLPEYKIYPKYHPYPDDVMVLADGTIIVPIRGTHGFGTDTFNWDHIEIYNPETDNFYAETNIDTLKDNLFNINLDDGNILFINKENSYRFNVSTKKFEKLNDIDNAINKENVNKISKLLAEKTQCTLKRADTANFGDYSKILKLDDDKFLIFCGDYYSNYFNKNAYKKGCKDTVYFNYKKNIVKTGPKFIYPYMTAKIIKLNNKKYLVVGGLIVEQANNKETPHKYVQIIKVKN